MEGPFREALRTIAAKPVLLVTGGVLGIMFSSGLVIQLYLGSFLAERLVFLGALALPFVIGGAYGVARAEDRSLRGFFQEGVKNYFRILLPLIVLIFAAFLTLILLSIPLGLLGIGNDGNSILSMLLGIGVPFLFLTYFTDVVAVVEETGVFESIRRGIEFVYGRFFKVLLFYITTLCIAVPAVTIIGLVTEIVLFSRRPDLMEAFASGNVTAVQPSEIITALGPEGIWAYAITTIIVLIPAGTLLVVYKYCFFRNSAPGKPATVGEMDEKGRWYRY